MKKRNYLILLVVIALSVLTGVLIGNNSEQPTQTYKPINLLYTDLKNTNGFVSEIPSNWSLVMNGENVVIPENGKIDFIPSMASKTFGVNEVEFADTSWDQVDIYSVQPEESSAFDIMSLHDPEFGSWTTETIAGYQVKVFSESLDSGEVSKGGAGGKFYYIQFPDGNLYVIHKQALGNKEFEDGFNHFITKASRQ